MFKYPSAPFHKEWARDIMNEKHIELIGFRESAKTVWAMIKVIHAICYKKKRFIMFYCYDKSKATERLYDIVVQLQSNRKIKADFGDLFPDKRKDDDDVNQKKSVPDFITTNGIKVKASSIGESPRGAMFFAKDGSFRPDYIVLDDIDVDKSVQNVEIIDKNYSWLKGELMGGISAECQILLLGNVIKADGIVPRIEKDYRENKSWIIHRKAIVENGEITWSRFTPEALQERKEMLGEISYNQNYLLIPFSGGDTIIKRHQIQYRDCTGISFDAVHISIDPAISEKTRSDAFAICIIGKLGDAFYIIESIALQGEDKDPFRAVMTIYNLYKKYQASVVIVETIAFQQVFAKLLSAQGIATKEVKPHKDKVTRVMEKQHLFEQKRVFFNTTGTQSLVSQLLDFPNVLNDDEVDAMTQGLDQDEKIFQFFSF